MTAQELIDFIEAFNLYDSELEVQICGEVFPITNATQTEDGMICLVSDDDE